MNKFIRDELDAANDSSEFGKLARDATVVRGGQEFSDQFYSQHMRFYKGVCKKLFQQFYSNFCKFAMFFQKPAVIFQQPGSIFQLSACIFP